MDMAKYRALFLSESRDHLNNLVRQVVGLEQDPTNHDGIDAAFREAHSIKGMAASMGFQRTADLAHHLEDQMDRFRQGGSVPASGVDHLLEGVDLLEGLLDDIADEKPEREIKGYLAGENPVVPEEEEASPTLPVSEEKEVPVCHLMLHLAPEAEAPSARLLLLARELQRLGELTKTEPGLEALERGEGEFRLEAWLRTELSPSRLEELLSSFIDVSHVRVNLGDTSTENREEEARTVRVRTDLLDRFIRLTGELITNRTLLQDAQKNQDWLQVRDGLNQLSRMVTDLHYHVLQVRMMPLQAVTDRLPRIVRELARKQGKQIRLSLEGEELELDRGILEELADPLMHLLRNSVDHGIAQQGEIHLRAWREKDQALIEIADNGRGIDPEAVREKAIENGLLTAVQARNLRDIDLLSYICHPGFSTAGEVTETSGRGVGMDVVKTAVDRLGGVLHIESELGVGTRFVLKLPLSVAIVRVLLVECKGHLMAMPITRVLRTLELERDQLQSSGKQLMIPLEDELIPLLSLRKALQMPARPMNSPVPIVLAEIRGRKVGLVVDRLAGQQEVFVQPVPYPIQQLEGTSGCTILGDGRVVFLLDLQGLFLPASTPVVTSED